LICRVSVRGTVAATLQDPAPPVTISSIRTLWRTNMTPADVLKLIKDKEAKFADLRFTDTIGKEQHVTIPARLVDDGFFKDGKMFDGSSIAGWKGINESDMILMPDVDTAVIDPFYEETTVNIR
jgi:glutamine synthetase